MSTDGALGRGIDKAAQQGAFDAIYRSEQYGDADKSVESHKRERANYLRILINAFPASGGKNFKCLEIGCGTGIDSCIVAKETGCRASGIDISREALVVARNFANQAGVSLDLQCADAFCLPFADNCFDLVFSQGVLEHLGDEKAAMREQARVLKKGGTLVVSVPQRYTFYTFAKHRKIRKGEWPWGYECEYSARQLARLGKEQGLKIVSRAGHGYWLHPMEPAWVLRSLFAKIEKIMRPDKGRLFAATASRYDRLWLSLEKRFGHLFMRSVVIGFAKSWNA